MNGSFRQLFRRGRGRGLGLTAVALGAAAALTLGVTGAFGDPNPGQFQLQGDTTQTGGHTGDDWDNVFAGTAGDFSHTFILGTTEAPANDTTAWVQSTKVTDPISSWGWQTNTSVINDKTNITDAYAAAYKGPSSHTIMYFGLDRFDNSGDANVGFWFLQDPNFALNSNGTFAGQHVNGDIFIQSGFTNGGGIANPIAFEWENGSLVQIVTGAVCTSSTQTLCAIDNMNSAVDAPWPYTTKGGSGQTQIPTNAFFEGGFDITSQFNTTTLPCFTHFIAQTATSSGNSETLKDLAAGNVQSCGTIELKKHWVGPAGTTQLNVGTTDGAHDVLAKTVSGQDGTTGAKQVEPNTYYLSENLTNPSAYTSTIHCFNDKNQNGTQDNGEPDVTATASASGWSAPLSVGDHVVCTITNTQIPQVKVNKTLVPSSDTGRFDLQIDGQTTGTGANVGDGGTTGFVNETVGATPTVGEVGHTGTNLANYDSSISCSNGQSGSGTSLKLNALAAGDQVTCTVTNKRKPTLTVNKVVVPASDTGKFNLQIDGQTAGTGANVGNGGTTGAVQATVGSHTVGETAGTGTSLSDYTAVISGDCAADGSVTLAAGDNKVCTITNTKQATVVVKKVMVGGTGSFAFTGDPHGTISSSGGTISEQVAPGQQYVSTETPVAGWQLTDVSCDNANGVGDKNAGTATFNPTAGQTITCTFTNTKQPTLTVNKVVVPADDTGKFNLQIDGQTAGTGANVGNGGTTGAVQMTVGSHTVGETAGTGTSLSDYTAVISGDCAADGSVTLAAGQNKVCTITNTLKPVAVQLVKTADAASVSAGDQVGFTLTVFNTGSGTAHDVTLTDTLPTNAGLDWSIKTQGAGWGSNACAINAGVLTCGGSGTDVAPVTQGASTFTVHIISPTTADTTGTTNQDLCPGTGVGIVNNTGHVTSSNDGSPSSSDHVCVLPADVQLVKTADAASVSAGDQVGFTLTVFNTGSGTAHDVTLTDTLPTNAGLDWSIKTQGAGWGSNACAINAGVLTCGGSGTDVAPVTQGASTFTVHIISPTTTGTASTSCGDTGNVNNTGHATSSNDGSPSDSAFVCVTPNTIELRKHWEGGTSTTTLSIGTDQGTHDVAQKTVTGDDTTGAKTVVPGMYFVSETSVSGFTASLSCVNAAANNEPVQVFAGNAVSVGSGDAIVCTFTNAKNPPPPSNPITDLAITKTGSPNPVTTGNQITWTMVVTNNGPTDDTGVSVSDPIPAGTTFISVTSTQGTCGATGTTVMCSIGNMPVGATVTITLVTTANTAGTITNTGTVAGNLPETTLENNTASASVTANAFVPPPARPCSAVKSSTRLLYVGRTMTLTIHVTQKGKPAAGIRIRIVGPGGLNIKTKPSNSNGIVSIKVHPKKAGIVRMTPALPAKACNTARVGITNVFTPPVTG